MLHSASNVGALARTIRKYSLKNIVIDPVIISSSGKRLAGKEYPAGDERKALPPLHSYNAEYS